MIVECPGCRSRYDVTGRPPGTRARCRCGTVFELPHPVDQAEQLACPACGGNVAPTNHACEWCDAQLLVKACPRCFARMFHGSKHCARCGANAIAPASADPDGNATTRPCPRCQQPTLVGQLVGDVLLDECPECHGVYVDRCALERILSERRQARAQAIFGTVRNELGEPTAKVQSGPMYVKCPDCEQLMSRKSFARGAGVIVDVCRAHGTWFDANELPKVVEFAMNGGLEQAAIKDAQRAREEARQARREANAARARAGSSLTSGGYRDSAFYGSLLGALGGGLLS